MKTNYARFPGPAKGPCAWRWWWLLALGWPTAPWGASAQPLVTVSPSVGITLESGSAVSIFWPKTAVGFDLETSPVLGPDAVWQIAPYTPAERNGMLLVVVPPEADARFFRLAAYSPSTQGPAPGGLGPQLTITQPVTNFAAVFRTNASPIKLAGTVSDPSAEVSVQGVAAVLDGTNWSANAVALNQEGPNLISITATNLLGVPDVQPLVIVRDTTVLKPEGLQVIATGATTNHLVWLDSGEGDLVATTVFRRPAGGSNYVVVGSAMFPLTGFDDPTVAAGSNYCYRTQATDKLGNQSPFSDEVCAPGFGGGAGGLLSLTGGSVDPAGNTSGDILATVLDPPTRIRETNGTLRIRYVQYVQNVDSDAARFPTGTVLERPGPRPIQLLAGRPNWEERLSDLLVEKPDGFGDSLTVSVTLPAGFWFNVLPTNIVVNAWATYAAYGPLFPAPAPGTAPDWDPQHSLATVIWDTNTLDNIGLAVLPSATSNQFSFSIQGVQQIVARAPDENGNYTNAYSGLPNIQAFSIDLGTPLFYYLQYHNAVLMQVDPAAVAGRAPKLAMTVNGAALEAGLCMVLDPEPLARAPLVRPADDAGGSFNILSGDYAFKVGLFSGNGAGLNLDGSLSYSSWNGSWDAGALQQGHPEGYRFNSFGPGWGYPYGMRIIRRDVTFWHQGTATNNNDELLLVCPDGRVTRWVDTGTGSSYPANVFQEIYGLPTSSPALVHSPAPIWAQFSLPQIVATASNYMLLEVDQPTDGFQEIDFDLQGRMTKVIPHGGQPPLTIAYQGPVQTVTDSSGRVAEFRFDSADVSGKIVEIIDPSGGDWEPQYWPGGALKAITEVVTGYGWRFAYDNSTYLLTERQLPHGFVVQSQYATPPSLAYPTNSFWGALISTRWKEDPTNSTRLFTYQRNHTNSPTPDRVSVTTPSGRNTSLYDLTAVTNICGANAHIPRPPSSIKVTVRTSDRTETNSAVERWWDSRTAYNVYQLVDHGEDAFNSNFSVTYQGQYLTSITRADLAVHSWTLSTAVGLTRRAPVAERDWRREVTNSYVYYDGRTVAERIKAVFPPGQSPTDPAARMIRYDYDSAHRLQFITDQDSNVTQFVYHTTVGKLGLPAQVIRGASPPGSTTGTQSPCVWSFDYDGLGRLVWMRDPNANVTSHVYDTAGHLVLTTGPTNSSGPNPAPQTTYEYQGDLVRLVTTRTSATESQTATYVYDPMGKLRMANFPGNDPSGKPSQTTYTYDADGNLTNVFYPNGGRASRQFDNRGRLTRRLGPEGEITEYDYDDRNDQITEIRRVDGTEVRQWTVLFRDPLLQPLDIKLPQVTQDGVTDRPERFLYYDADGHVTNALYQFGGNIASSFAAFGLFGETTQIMQDMGFNQSMVWTFVSDYAGRTTQAIGPTLGTLSSPGSSTSVGKAVISREPNRQHPNVLTYTYNLFNSISNISDVFGNERVRLGVDPAGLLQQIRVPNPAVAQSGTGVTADTLSSSLTRDNFNLPNGVVDALGASNLLARDLGGRAIVGTDAAGVQTKTVWSPAGDPATLSTVAGGQTLDGTRSRYDDLGNLKQVTGPGVNGAGTTFAYDLSGRVTNTIDAVGYLTSYEYNRFGELVRKTNPLGSYITYAHDGLGRVVSTVEYGLTGNVSRTESRQYDWQGNLSAVEDAKLRIEYESDYLGRILEKRTLYKTIGATNTLIYSYGEYGDPVLFSNDRYASQYLWDDLGNLTNLTFTTPGPTFHKVVLRRDAVGKLQGSDLQSGTQAVVKGSVGYDAKGRRKTLSYASPGGSATALPSFAFARDGNDRITNLVDNARGVNRALAYDSLGRLQAETWRQLSDGQPDYQDQIGYDQAGNRVWRQLNGSLSTYTYDQAYRLMSETNQTLVRLPPTLIQTSADSTNGPGYGPQLANDQRSPNSDAPGTGWRSDTNQVDHWMELDLGASHPISAVEVSVPTARGGLDDFVVEASDSEPANFQVLTPYQVFQGYKVSTNALGTRQHTVRVVFAPPALASRIRVLVPRGGSGYDPLSLAHLPDVVINEVAIYEGVTQTISFAYDPDGRLTNDGAFSYSYDVQGRLTGVRGTNQAGALVDKTWTITPEGLRGSEVDNTTGESRFFANDGPNVCLEFTVSGGVATPRLTYLNGFGADTHIGFLEFAADGTSSFRWMLTDTAGSITEVLDEDGTVLDTQLYSGWGENPVAPTHTSANPYGFAGARQDPETGLYYNRARMFDPHVGRFTSTDPAGMIDGPNTYLYASNDPVGWRDPSGFEDESVETRVARMRRRADEIQHGLGYKLTGSGMSELFALKRDIDILQRGNWRATNIRHLKANQTYINAGWALAHVNPGQMVADGLYTAINGQDVQTQAPMGRDKGVLMMVAGMAPSALPGFARAARGVPLSLIGEAEAAEQMALNRVLVSESLTATREALQAGLALADESIQVSASLMRAQAALQADFEAADTQLQLVGSLNASALEFAEQARFLGLFEGNYQGGMVSATYVPGFGTVSGMSLRQAAQGMTPGLITPEVGTVVRGIANVGGGRLCFCAEKVAISNIQRLGLSTRGSVSMAIRPECTVPGQIAIPCTNCQRLLRLSGMGYVDETGEIIWPY